MCAVAIMSNTHRRRESTLAVCIGHKIAYCFVRDLRCLSPLSPYYKYDEHSAVYGADWGHFLSRALWDT